MVDRQPDQAVDGAAILLGEMTDRRIDPEQAWFWSREWQQREREADEDLAADRMTRYEWTGPRSSVHLICPRFRGIAILEARCLPA